MVQVCGTHQCDIHLNDFRTIHHKLDSALPQHLQNVNEELVQFRICVELVVPRLHAYADLFVLLVR